MSPYYYDKSCPKAMKIIAKVVKEAVHKEQRKAGALIRLHFHDCFVMGCDGSILLDTVGDMESEKEAPMNKGSMLGFEIIDQVKSEIEKACPGVFSCADIVAVAARDASVFSDGPGWKVKLGRKDSKISSIERATSDLPLPNSDVDELIARFKSNGLDETDMVALSGAHTIGKARCLTYRNRIYENSSYINPSFQKQRQNDCPVEPGQNDNFVEDLDLVTPKKFDNNYFKLLYHGLGLLTSDQALYLGGEGKTDKIVLNYAKNQRKFFRDFAKAMIKMGDIHDLTGSSGEIRKHCRKKN